MKNRTFKEAFHGLSTFFEWLLPLVDKCYGVYCRLFVTLWALGVIFGVCETRFVV